MQDDSVPQLLPLDEVKSAVGIDVGLKEFLTTSDGDTVAIPQIYRRTQYHLARQQRQLARQQSEKFVGTASVHKTFQDKGSRRQAKKKNHIARIHQKIERQRQDFHYKTAHKLVKNFDLIAVEDLNIKGLARTKLSKSILDAAWGAFINILEAVAVKRGVRVVKVNPHSTSQNCSACGHKVPKTLSVRLHHCPKCGLLMDRDENAAINILNRAINEVGLILSARGGFGAAQPVKREAFLEFDGSLLSSSILVAPVIPHG
ncbi:RNA-guided endonuclease InsQ/TnpB family protein [Fortiea sp. LEGE XX443]|uniref:RNA-guided endonuclease InsQ/TnpB family protein n=1 Tax=Fortiea sp. LEGE XX443 TaxID=1828611 RepID=UPI001D145F98|nr:transposase [Fortiea sp. LEGE XX443]